MSQNRHIYNMMGIVDKNIHNFAYYEVISIARFKLLTVIKRN